MVAAIAELVVVKVIDNLVNRSDSNTENGKTHYESGEHHLIGDGKTAGLHPRNIVQKLKESSIGRRIDLLAAILFPLLFIVYMIVFFNSHLNREELSDI